MSSLVLGLALGALVSASADAQGFQTLGGGVNVRSGHLLAADRVDFVAASNGQLQIFRTDTNTVDRVFAPDGPTNNLNLIDVVDLDGDGRDEIVLVNGSTQRDVGKPSLVNNDDGAFYILPGNCTPNANGKCTARATLLAQASANSATGIGINSLKIYQRSSGGGRSIVVAPSTSSTALPGTVYFFHNGTAAGSTTLPSFAGCNDPDCNDGITFPAIAVDDLDPGSGNGKEIVIVGKSRLLEFDENGNPLAYRQFVDDSKGFTNYNADADPTGYQGRRYGHIQIVPSLNSDAVKDLVILADALSRCKPGQMPPCIFDTTDPSVLQALPLSRPASLQQGAVTPLGGFAKTPMGNKGLTPAGEPLIGLALNGIQDVDGVPGRPEAVVSFLNAGQPMVRVYTWNGSQFVQLGRDLRGTCLDVVRTDRSTNLPDLVLWNKATATIDVWRWATGARAGGQFEMVASIPASQAPALHDSTNFTLDGPSLETHGSSSDFSRLILPGFGGESFFLLSEKTSASPCGRVRSFRLANRTLQPSLDEPTNPGRIQLLVPPAVSNGPSLFAINTFGSTCGVTGRIDLYTQSADGKRLVPLGSGSPPAASLTVSPASLAFAATAGGANPAAQALNVGSTGAALSFTVSDDATWLTVAPASGTTPATLTATVNTAGLAAGNYSATITASGAGNSPISVPVSLSLAGGPPPTANLTVSPTSLAFSGQQGGANPAARTLSVASTGSALAFTASDSATWLTVTPASATTPATLTAAVNLAGLPAGSYLATITLTAAGAGNSPLTLTVSLTVSPVTPTSQLTVNPASLSFSAPQGGPAPAIQVLSIGSTGGPLAWSLGDNATFVNESLLSGSTPGATNVSINVGGLLPGSYSAVITVSASGANPVAVPVNLTVTAVGPAAPVVNGFNPVSGPTGSQVEILGFNFDGVTAVTFNGAPSPSFPKLPNGNLLATVPGNATTGLIRVTNAGGTGASFTPFTVTVANAPAISGFNPPSGAVGDRITISGANFTSAAQVFFNGTKSPFVLPGGPNLLSAEVPSGASSGPIQVTTAGGSATSAGNFVVTGSPPPPPPTASLVVSPASLVFSGQQGGANPTGQGIAINSTGTALSWTATSNANWLSLSPATGVTGITAVANVNLAGLAAGSYSGTLTISAMGSTATVNVSLTVGSAPPPGGGGLAITLLSPNSGNFTTGQTILITWSSTGATSHRVQYSTDGLTFTPIVTGLPATQMSYSWKIPNAAAPSQETASLTIRVIAKNDTTNTTAQDTNDGPINVFNPF